MTPTATIASMQTLQLALVLIGAAIALATAILRLKTAWIERSTAERNHHGALSRLSIVPPAETSPAEAPSADTWLGRPSGPGCGGALFTAASPSTSAPASRLTATSGGSLRSPRGGPARRTRKLIVFGCLGLLAVGLFGASRASAESAWWQLNSGTRPGYLHGGVAKPGVNEVQKVTVDATGGSFFLANMTKAEVQEEEYFCTSGPKFAELPFNASVAEVQKGLEGICGYGAGNVEVGGVVGEYTITFKGALAARPVRAINTEIPAGELEGTIAESEITAGVAPAPDGEIYVSAENLGDASLSGARSPVTLSDVLPVGLKAIAIEGTRPFREGNFLRREALPCSLESLSCTLDKSSAPHEALAPYDQLEMRISVIVEAGALSGAQNEVAVSGGESYLCRQLPAGAGNYRDSGCMDEAAGGGFERVLTGSVASTSVKRPITISSLATPFGVETYKLRSEEDGGSPITQAGTHPFQQTTTIALNQAADKSPPGRAPEGRAHVLPAALPKDLHIKWPAGLIGNPTPIAQCTDAQFFTSTEGGGANLCSPQSAVGVATVTINEPSNTGVAEITVPLFNLVPRVGEPARFGFNVIQGNAPVTIDTSIRSGGDYGVTVSVNNITQTAAFLSSSVTVWGVPGDPRHNRQRGWACLLESRGATLQPGGLPPCVASGDAHPPAFTSLPTSCEGPLQTSVEADSWSQVGDFQPFSGEFEPALSLDGCNRLPFSAEIKVAPDSQRASTPTGLNVDVHVPQDESLNAAGLASSNIKDINVVMPEGVSLNPAAADGLQACAEGQIGYLPSLSSPPREVHFTETLPEPLQPGVNFCPDAAKVGTAKIKTPLLPNPLEGAVYLAAPAPNAEEGQNPFKTLVAIYIVAKDPVSGVLVKLPGRVTLNQQSGRIEANFENTPQAAFEDAEVHFFGGERAPLSTPSRCGTYTTEATFTPWSGTPPIKSSSSFQITSGPNGGPCPNPLPFAPTLAAGSPNINAGSFSALSTTISREDGNQDINTVQLHMAPGMSGILAGVPLCGEAEANAGTCPPASQIGETIVSVGLGGDPFTVTGGKVYLTEKYQGAPFGLSIVNPADAGPFHLGKVIVRARIEVDPLTTALTITTGAIPHILDGIPLQIKHVNVNVNRPGFTFNPTNCDPKTITGTIGSVEGAASPVSVPFQVSNCANLKFAPKFSVSTAGKTSKAAGASLSVKLTYPPAPLGTYANVAKVKVSLPKQLPSRLTTLQKACTAAVFDANPASCPKESIVGQAKVLTPLLPVPLVGPAYFVSHGGEAFPDLTMVLQGYGVTAELVGSTSIKNGITTSTFKATPDVPFSSFELKLPQGKFSALAANANLCTAKLTMPSEFTAQNGAVVKQTTKIAVGGCAKPKPDRAKQLAKALKACHKKKGAKRGTCERTARKRFGVKKAKKAKQGSSKGAGKGRGGR
jgi:hypothetical protein